MEWEIIHIAETDSTNHWLRENRQLTANSEKAIAVYADYQTAGRGCGTNRWESERHKNLLFSLLLHPEQIHASKQFHISMAVDGSLTSHYGGIRTIYR